MKSRVKYKFILVIGLFLLIFISCRNKILTESELKKSDIEHIKFIGLLDDGEEIFKFYSTHKNSVSGNFFTNKRLASYWLDENHEDRRAIVMAYYSDIVSLDTVYSVGFNYSPYIRVGKSDSTEFKLYVDGKPEEMKSFYEDVLSLWRGYKNEQNKK